MASVALIAYLFPSDPFNRAKIYSEPQGNFSFAIPDSFNIAREETAENEIFLKVTAPNDQSLANPGLIDISVYKKNPDMSLSDHASAYLSVSSDKIKNISVTRSMFYYASQNGQELSFYYFYETQGNIVVVKFNKSYFDKSNPMMLVDNSGYINTFLRTLNSFKFSD